ncbi:MAG: metalloregulator ArsR/SmtB family transcription factor [Anaerolineales bacterium]
MEEYESEIKALKALSHPARLAILEILRGGEQCVCHLEAILGLRQAYISQQLMTLRDAGLVQDRRDGWNNYYRVIRPEIFNVLDAVRQMVGNPAAEPGVSPVACACPNCRAESEQTMNSQFEIAA